MSKGLKVVCYISWLFNSINYLNIVCCVLQCLNKKQFPVKLQAQLSEVSLFGLLNLFLSHWALLWTEILRACSMPCMKKCCRKLIYLCTYLRLLLLKIRTLHLLLLHQKRKKTKMGVSLLALCQMNLQFLRSCLKLLTL